MIISSKNSNGSGISSNSTVLELTTFLVHAKFEKTFFSPSSSPGISNQPIILAIFGAPANNFDGMTT